MALAVVVLWRKSRIKRPVLPSEGRTFVLLWVLPFVVFLFGRNKDIRFTAPLLPAVSLVLAWKTDSYLSSLKRLGKLAFSLVFAFPLLAYLHTSFGLLGSARLAWGCLVLLAPRLSHARPPDPQAWPHQEILEVLRFHSEFARERRVMLGTDTNHFNANNFELAAADGLFSFQITTSAYEESLTSLLNAANSTTFFVYKEDGERGPQYTNRLFKSLLEDVQSSGKFDELPFDSYLPKLPTLPDGGRVIVHKNKWPNSPIIEAQLYRDGVDWGQIDLPAVTVNFSNVMRLTGLEFRIEQQWLKVIYRWNCIGKLDQDLLCFTHILNDQGKIVGFLDHVILGDPTLTQQQGWGASESLRHRLPDGVSRVHLRLGLFREVSGERLRIQEANGDADVTISLTDQGTAVVARGMARSLPRLSPSQTE